MKKMEEKIRVKDEGLAELKEELLVKQTCLDDMNVYVTVSRHSNELDEWRRETKKQLDRISTLQQQVAVKEEILVATKINEMSNLRHQLLRQSDLLSGIMRSYTDKERIFQYVLADKKRIINQLQADNEIYVAELNNAKNFMQQMEMSHMSVKQELTNNKEEMTEKIRVKVEELAKLKEELIMKQNYFNEWQKQS